MLFDRSLLELTKMTVAYSKPIILILHLVYWAQTPKTLLFIDCITGYPEQTYMFCFWQCPRVKKKKHTLFEKKKMCYNRIFETD